MNTRPDDLLKVAERAARKAGAYLLEHWGKIKPEQIDEKGQNDFVTFVDKNAEQLIIDEIHATFPEQAILAEERGEEGKPSPVRWIIDPLDGTKNYIRSLPYFCVSIGVEREGEIVAGVVYDPLHKELFKALKNQGAFLNEQKIQVTPNKNFRGAILCTGFPHRSKTSLPQYLKAFEEMFIQSSGMRRMGSAALDLCYTACGRFHGFWELGLNAWDIAAASLILREAGGALSDFRGNPHVLDSGSVIAANPALHSRMLEIISYHFYRITNDSSTQERRLNE